LYPELPKEKHHQMVSVIQRETTRLSEMATSYLDLARLESGRSSFELQSIQPADLLAECAILVQTNVTENGLTFEPDFQADLPNIQGDFDKIKQAVINLLSNSIKYNRPAGEVRLRAFANDKQLIIAVEDTGIGIPKEHQTGLFEKFYRVPGSENVSAGTGLGLAVVKRIIEGHKGSIEVDSTPGEGTTFSIYLPIS